MNVKNLLELVAVINKKYEGIAEITGENYNIFRILKLTRSEVRTHSAFLGELLNPSGSHGQKETFLKLFCETLEISNFDCKNATVNVEKFIGYISEDKGGYIDILVTDKNNRAIIIENKINANDQEKQLLRYFNYGQKYQSPKLFYLTLYGKDATDVSKSGLNEKDFERISYHDKILDWLKSCKEKAVNHPILRETITQYINLIKYLTNQTMNDEMKDEIVKSIINNPDYIESAQVISNNWKDVKIGLILRLKDAFETEASKSGLKVELYGDLRKDGSGYSFFKEGWRTSIRFEFDDDFEMLSVGIFPRNDNDSLNQELRILIQQQLSNLELGKFLDYPNWYWLEVLDKWDSIAWKEVKENAPTAIFETLNEILTHIEGKEGITL